MFTIGCDPEMFLFDNLLQRIVPAVGKVGGSKMKPMKLSKGTVQLDGTVVEIGTDPASTAEEWIDNVQSVISEVQAKLDARFHGRYSLRCGAMAGYSEEDITFSRTAFEVGCEPAYLFDSDTGELVRTSSTGNLNPSRIPIGGHIHVGVGCNLPITDEVLIHSCKMFSDKVYDKFYEISSHAQTRRRLDTGCTNSLRIKPYGLELREWSSYWLASRECMVKIFEGYKAVYESLINQSPLDVPTLHIELSEMYKAQIIKPTYRLPEKYQRTLPLDF